MNTKPTSENILTYSESIDYFWRFTVNLEHIQCNVLSISSKHLPVESQQYKNKKRC